MLGQESQQERDRLLFTNNVAVSPRIYSHDSVPGSVDPLDEGETARRRLGAIAADRSKIMQKNSTPVSARFESRPFSQLLAQPCSTGERREKDSRGLD